MYIRHRAARHDCVLKPTPKAPVTISSHPVSQSCSRSLEIQLESEPPVPAEVGVWSPQSGDF